MATHATTCCARTSRHPLGTRRCSISPWSIARHRAADSSRSAGVLAISRPLLTPCTTCPARPTRWSPRATFPGDSTWQTRSTAPMSIPSSSEAVATTADELAVLEGLLGGPPLVQAQAAVMGPERRGPPRRSIVGHGRLVEPAGQLLDHPPVIREDDRRAVLRGPAPPAYPRSPARSCRRRAADRGWPAR